MINIKKYIFTHKLADCIRLSQLQLCSNSENIFVKEPFPMIVLIILVESS